MKSVTILYLILLGVLAGAVIALGAFAAPVVFHPECVGLAMSHFDSGRLMSQIFICFNLLLGFVAVFVLLYEEGWRMIRKGELDKAVLIGAFGLVMSAGAYLFWITPGILAAQAAGEAATLTEDFRMLHWLAEIDFKLILLFTFWLFGLRVARLMREE